MHLKRNNIGKFWPVPRKGTKYMAVPLHNQKDSIPLVLAMRDILKIARNSKEVKKALFENKIMINQKIVKETNYPLNLFDVLSFPEEKKSFRVILSLNKKMLLEEISEKDSLSKLFKILSKKLLPNKKIQINLIQGMNLISKEKMNIGDSILYNFKEKKIENIIPFEKGREVFIVKGAHAGRTGKIEDIVVRGGKIIAKINSEKEKINVWNKNVIVVK